MAINRRQFVSYCFLSIARDVARCFVINFRVYSNGAKIKTFEMICNIVCLHLRGWEVLDVNDSLCAHSLTSLLCTELCKGCYYWALMFCAF